jgi:hypothetical protein
MSEIDEELEEEGRVFLMSPAYKGFVLAMGERKRLLQALLEFANCTSNYIRKNFPGEAHGFEDEGLAYPPLDVDNPPFPSKKA